MIVSVDRDNLQNEMHVRPPIGAKSGTFRNATTCDPKAPGPTVHKNVIVLRLVVLFAQVCHCGCQLLQQSPAFEAAAEFNQLATAVEPDFNLDTVDSAAEYPDQGPTSIIDAADESTLPRKLTLETALHFALANSKEVRVLELVPREVRTGIDQEQAHFDPSFAGGGQWGKTSQQVESAVQALGTNLTTFQATQFGAAADLNDQLQLEKRWQTGTRARLGYSTNYNFNDPAGQFLVVNPAWKSGARLTLEQPIFQGAGSQVNQLGLKIARARHGQSLREFRAGVNRILHDVETSWWQLYQAKANVESLSEMLRIAELTWNKERARYELGQNSVAEESQALENLEGLRARAAAAEGEAATAERVVLQQLGLDPAYDQPIEILADPYLEPFSPDLESGIASAMRSREEVRAQQDLVQLTAFDLKRERDSLLPAVNLVGGYGLSGLNTGLQQSVSDLSTGEFGDWNIGVTFRQILGQRAERASVRRAEFAHTRARMTQKQGRDLIAYEVRSSFDESASAYKVFKRQESRQQAAHKRFETHRRMYETGQLDLDRFLRSQEAYVLAQRDYHAAVAQYNLSIHRWFYVTGQLTLDSAAGHLALLAQGEEHSLVTAPVDNAGSTEKDHEIPASAVSFESNSDSQHPATQSQ